MVGTGRPYRAFVPRSPIVDLASQRAVKNGPRATATWFGPPQRSLFGWVHVPAASQARGAVVLCPPLGLERTNTYLTYRRLAESLADRGLLAVRFDYDGTGDSAGDEQDPDRVRSWIGSVDRAIALATDAGCSSVALVGMRLGGLLAAHAAARSACVDTLVLWDPCPSGRGFVRELQSMQLLRFGDASRVPDGVDLPGWLIRRDTHADLRSLGAPALSRTVRRVLVLSRPNRSRPDSLVEPFRAAHVEWAAAFGQENLLEIDPIDHTVPEETSRNIVEWLATAVHDVPRPVSLRPQKVATIKTRDALLTEQLVALGPIGLFGVVTTCDHRPIRPGVPWALFLNTGNDPHVGPCRLWVQLARRWAAAGVPSVRFDVSGLGDSPTREGQPENVIRAPEAFADIEHAAAALSPDDPSNVLLVGVCSGGYQALDSATTFRGGPPRGAYAINPLLRFAPPEMARGPMDACRRICRPAHPLSRSSRRLPVGPLRRGWWWLVWCVAHPRPLRRRTWLGRLAAGGTDVVCIGGEPDTAEVTRSGGKDLERFRGQGVQVTTLAGLDHGLHLASERELVANLLTAHVTTRFGAARDGAATPQTGAAAHTA